MAKPKRADFTVDPQTRAAEEQLKRLERERAALEQTIAAGYARSLELPCLGNYGGHDGKGNGCGQMIPVGQLTLLEKYWYEQPHGCTGGDSWHFGEYAYACPCCGKETRFTDHVSKYASDPAREKAYHRADLVALVGHFARRKRVYRDGNHERVEDASPRKPRPARPRRPHPG